MSEEFNEENVTMADLEDHFDDANPWNVVKSYMEKGTVLPVKVEGIVNGGAIAMVEGLRGFIPASKLALDYVEDDDLNDWLGKELEVLIEEEYTKDGQIWYLGHSREYIKTAVPKSENPGYRGGL